MVRTPRPRGTIGRLARWAVISVSIAYPAALVVTAIALRFIGERWWVTGVALYLPRLPLLLPLLLIVPCLLLAGLRRLLWTQAFALWVGLFPLLGLVLPWPSFGGSGPKLRVASCNVNSGHGAGFAAISQQILALEADLILVQELLLDPAELVRGLRTQYDHVDVSTQFLIATDFPVVSSVEPDKVHHEGRERSPRFMQYVVDTTLGRITVYNVHPISPRESFYKLREGGFRHQLGLPQPFKKGAERFRYDTALRGLQIETVAAMARAVQTPVIIGGDLNLPGLSTFSSHLADYQDGFSAAGSGFGYTYPNHERWPPWMRLDRVLASDALKFTDFDVQQRSISDHRCVVAELVKRDP